MNLVSPKYIVRNNREELVFKAYSTIDLCNISQPQRSNTCLALCQVGTKSTFSPSVSWPKRYNKLVHSDDVGETIA